MSTTGSGQVLAKAMTIASVAEMVLARPVPVHVHLTCLRFVHVPYLARSEQSIGMEVATVVPGQGLRSGRLQEPEPASSHAAAAPSGGPADPPTR